MTDKLTPESKALIVEGIGATVGCFVRFRRISRFPVIGLLGAALFGKDLTDLQWFCLITACGLWWIGEKLHELHAELLWLKPAITELRKDVREMNQRDGGMPIQQSLDDLCRGRQTEALQKAREDYRRSFNPQVE